MRKILKRKKLLEEQQRDWSAARMRQFLQEEVQEGACAWLKDGLGASGGPSWEDGTSELEETVIRPPQVKRGAYQATATSSADRRQQAPFTDKQEILKGTIQRQLGNLLTLNSQVTIEAVISGDDADEYQIEEELYSLQNAFAMTNPALLSQVYQSRLSVMEDIQYRLNKVLEENTEYGNYPSPFNPKRFCWT